VLIYVLMADRVVEIIADRGIAERIAPPEWEAVCRQMELHYRAGRFREGSIAGIEGVGALLGRHFPGRNHSDHELPNQPVLQECITDAIRVLATSVIIPPRRPFPRSASLPRR